MKKILILLPFLFFITSCVESELIIPGENVGGGSGSDTTPTGTVLRTYEYNANAVAFNVTQSMSFNATGKLSQLSVGLAGAQETATFNRNADNNITSVNYSTIGEHYSTEYTFTYDDSNRVTKVSAGTTPTTELNITYTSATAATAVRTLNGTDDYNFTYTFDSSGIVSSITITNIATNEYRTINFVSSQNNATGINVDLNGTSTASFSATHDDKINPLQMQIGSDFNILTFIGDFEFDPDTIDAGYELYARVLSQNNVLTFIGSGASINTNASHTFEYNADNYPTGSTFTDVNNTTGTTTYTYY